MFTMTPQLLCFKTLVGAFRDLADRDREGDPALATLGYTTDLLLRALALRVGRTDGVRLVHAHVDGDLLHATLAAGGAEVEAEILVSPDSVSKLLAVDEAIAA